MGCDSEDGQALAEFALIAPLLVLMLGGIMYCGALVLAQENLAMTARAAARQMAIEGTERALTQGDARAGSPQAAVSQATSMAGVQATGVNWSQVELGDGHGINSTMAVFAKTGSIHVGKRSYRCGIGCLLYGVKVTKDLAHDLSPGGKLVAAMGGRLSGVASLGAVGVMPGDLPPRGGEGSVMGLNGWITDIVNSNDKNL